MNRRALQNVVKERRYTTVENKKGNLGERERRCITTESLEMMGGIKKCIYGANFSDAVFEEGSVSGFSFINCDFSRADFMLKFEECIFSGCDFRKAEINSLFYKCKLSCASFDQAILATKCEFMYSQVHMCTFRETVFRKCDIYCSELSHCDFLGAIFEEPEVERCKCRILWNLDSDCTVFIEDNETFGLSLQRDNDMNKTQIKKNIGDIKHSAMIEMEARSLLDQGINEVSKTIALRMIRAGKLTVEEIAEYLDLDIGQVEYLIRYNAV